MPKTYKIVTRTLNDFRILNNLGMNPNKDHVETIQLKNSTEIIFEINEDIYKRLDINNRFDNTMMVL